MKMPFFFGLMMVVSPLVQAGESYMDVDPQGLLCVGDAPATKYKQRCVARCVVNGVGSFAYAGRMVDAESGQGMELYSMMGEYRCPKGSLSRDVHGILLKDAREVAHNLCGKGNLVKVVNGPGMQSDADRASVHAIVGCRDAIRSE